jgi:hypothetical protein
LGRRAELGVQGNSKPLDGLTGEEGRPLHLGRDRCGVDPATPRCCGGNVEDLSLVRVDPEAEPSGLSAQLIDPKRCLVGQLYWVFAPRQLRMVVHVHEGGLLLWRGNDR